MEGWVVSSEIIIKNVIKIFLFILSFSLSAQSSINIKSPQEKTKIKAGDYLEIIWSYRNLNSQVQVSYSKDKINWNRIDQVNAIEKSLWWEVPNFYDSDGEIYLKVSSIRNKNISDNVSLRLPLLLFSTVSLESVLVDDVKDPIPISNSVPFSIT